MSTSNVTYTTLRSTKAPNLPIATVEYAQGYQDQFTNVLRLYFNQVDNFTSQISGPNGGKYIRFPHVSAYDSTSQFATANTATIVKFSTLSSASGFTLNANGTDTCNVSGIYKIDYSLQFANTDNASHDADVWMQVNNVNLTESTTRFTLQSRKSAGVYNYVCGYSHVTFQILAGDLIGLYWATDKAANASFTTDGIFIEALPASASPYSRPSIPSSIGTIAFISAPIS